MRNKSRTLIRCQDPRCRGIAIRDGEGCFSVGGVSRRVADQTLPSRCAVEVKCCCAGQGQTRMGDTIPSSANLPDMALRHMPRYQSTRSRAQQAAHKYAACEGMSIRRCGRAFLHSHDTAETTP